MSMLVKPSSWFGMMIFGPVLLLRAWAADRVSITSVAATLVVRMILPLMEAGHSVHIASHLPGCLPGLYCPVSPRLVLGLLLWGVALPSFLMQNIPIRNPLGLHSGCFIACLHAPSLIPLLSVLLFVLCPREVLLHGLELLPQPMVPFLFHPQFFFQRLLLAVSLGPTSFAGLVIQLASPPLLQSLDLFLCHRVPDVPGRDYRDLVGSLSLWATPLFAYRGSFDQVYSLSWLAVVLRFVSLAVLRLSFLSPFLFALRVFFFL